MNNTLLLQQFDLLATAPGGVAKLRELILTLAVQGKLVPQDPADEPASELLKRIRAEKDRLIAEGKIKRDKPLAAIAEDEQPFELPSGWEWVRLQHVGYTQTGTTPDKKNPAFYGTHTPFIKPGDIYPEFVNYDNEGLSESGLQDSGRLAPSGSILMVCIGTIGKTNIIYRDCSFNQQINSITPLLCVPEFVGLYLRCPEFQSEAWGRSSSTTISILNKGKWEEIPLALPPVPEQSRIVTRVEELMRVCNALEAKGQQQAAHHGQLWQTLLGTLTGADRDPDSATPTQDAWQRVAAHFDTLLDRPSAVDALEQTILQLAVRGQLVPQDPTDEPASELLKRIRAEKDQLIAEGKIKRDKPLALVGEDEQPFELPQGWAWVRLVDLGAFKGGKTPSTQRPEFWNGDIPWITPKDMKRSYLAESQDWVTSLAVSDGLGVVLPNSVLMVVRSGILRRTFPVAINTVPATINQDLKALELVQSEMATYLLLLLQGFEEVILKDLTKVGTTVESIQFDLFSDYCFPLPPFPEQARIVARVTHLRRLCADLRQRLTQSQATQAGLAEALVAVI